MDIFHVDDDALFGGEEIADFVAEFGCVIGYEFAVAFDDGGTVDAVGVEVEGVGGLWLGCVGQSVLLDSRNAGGL